MSEVEVTENCDAPNADQSEHNYVDRETTATQDNDNEDYTYVKVKKKKPRKQSVVWTKFTVLNKREYIASCDICGIHMSFRGTSSNLKKHLERKHNIFLDQNSSNYKPTPRSQSRTILAQGSRSTAAATPRRTLTELSGLDGLVFNVVADEGEDPLAVDGGHEEQFEEVQIQQEQASRNEHDPKSISDKRKRSRIMDLQLECLEIKKYNMQMEAMLLEQQLNLPRSIFTQPLRASDTYSRGTQTEVGGGNTKVFYVMDKQTSEVNQQIFSFRASLEDS